MTDEVIKRRLLSVTNLASEYCSLMQHASEMEKPQFVAGLLDCLPRIYWEFVNMPQIEDSSLDLGYMADYVDEDYYNQIRLHAEQLLGPDDTFLETFEEDMKYSDTPIAASVSESLADIFQALYNYLAAAREADDEQLIGIFNECRENFAAYWSQTLCNVLRPLNNIYFNPSPEV